MENIKLKTRDNVKIAANYYNGGKKNVLIVAPGWCMTKDSKAFKLIAESFTDDFDVFSMDFRGHGKSGGFYTFTSSEIFDIETCVNFLKPRYKKIYIMGFSLGSANALIYNGCAKEQGFYPVNKIIAVSAPSEFNRIENQMYKKEAWGETFKKTFGKNAETFEFTRFLTIRPSILPHKKIKPIDIVDKIDAPTFFIAGKKDPTVHFWHTAKLYEKAKCEKYFKLFEDGIHAEDIFLHFKEEFRTLCINWLK